MKSLLIVIVASLVLAGCKTNERIVTVERVHRDTLWRSNVLRDSIYLHDSIYVKEWQKGDTVWVEKTRFYCSGQERTRTDTIYKSKTDSIPVPYPVIKEVEKKLTKAQKGLMWTGGLSIMALLAFVYRKIRR